MRSRSILLLLLIGTNALSLITEKNAFSNPLYNLEYNPASDPTVNGINPLLYTAQTDRKILIEIDD